MKLEFNMQISFNEEIVLASPFYFLFFSLNRRVSRPFLEINIIAISYCGLWLLFHSVLIFVLYNIYKEVVSQTHLSNSLERVIFEYKILLQEFWCRKKKRKINPAFFLV